MTFPRSAVLAAIVALGCSFWLTLGGARSAGGASAASQKMYDSEQLVGTITAAQQMYVAADVAYYSGKLRLDEIAKDSKRKVGDILTVRYGVPKSAPAMAAKPGEQIRAKGAPMQAKGESWIALSDVVVLGRGECIRPGEGAVIDMGAPKARILVKMFAPLQTECHMKTADLLKSLAEREPDRVRVQIFDMATPAGREEMQKEGLTCATVLINNRYIFTIQTPTGPRKVALHHRPNDPRATYNSEDVITVVEQELKRLY
jgi:hypothetical protein